MPLEDPRLRTKTPSAPTGGFDGNEREWLMWIVRALGSAAGIPVGVWVVWLIWGDDIAASNARAAAEELRQIDKDAAIVSAWEAEAAKDAAEQALYEKRALESEQVRLRDAEWERKLKLEADKLESGG